MKLEIKVEVIELVQLLHQQLNNPTVHCLEPHIAVFGRHFNNLPRLRFADSPNDANILIGSSEDLIKNNASNDFVIQCNDEQVTDDIKMSLCQLGYKHFKGRLFRYSLKKASPEQFLRILILTNLYPPQELGGYGRSIYDFASNLRRIGHDVYVVTSNASYLGGDLGQEKQVNRNLKLMGTYDKKISIIQDPEEQIRISVHNQTVLLGVINSYRPNAALLGNLDMLGHEPLRLLINMQIPCWHHYGFSDPNMIPFPISCIPTCNEGYYPLANSHFTARSLSTVLHSHTPIRVIYPGAQTRFYSDLKPNPLGGPLRIVYAGLLIGVKGPHILLEALAKLKAWKVPFSCELAGGHIDEGFRQKLIDFTNMAGILDNVHFLGKLDRIGLRDLFSRGQVFVFPSTWQEPFGISQVEALAAGLLVISSATGGASETVHDDINGRRFRPGDSQHLADILMEVYYNPADHEHLRLRGRRLAQTHFDTARESNKLSDLMIQGSRPAPE